MLVFMERRSALAGFCVVVCAAALGAEKDPAAAAKARQALALNHAHALGDRFGKFRDGIVSAEAEGTLASVVCKYDHAYAVSLFERALGQLRDQDPGAGESGHAAFQFARSAVLRDAGQCDAKLAVKQVQGGADLGTAMSLASSDPDAAAQMAASAASSVLNHQQMSSLFFVLRTVRAKSPAAADQIFLQALQTIDAAQTFSPLTFLTLGNYLFGPVTNGKMGDAISYRGVGGVPTIDITANRSGATAALVRPYLETALDLLNRPLDTGAGGNSMESDTAQTRYAMAYQLVPKAQEFAPDLVGAFQSAMATLAANLPDSFLDPSTFGGLGTSIEDNSATTKEIAADSTDPARKDELRLNLISNLFRGTDTAKMRELARGMDDADAKAKVMDLIAFREGTLALEKKDIAGAKQAITALGPSGKRALLELGLAPLIKEHDQSYQTYSQAIRDAAYAPMMLTPNLLLAAARGLSALDADYAMGVLASAVDAYNELDRKYPQLAARGVSFSTGWFQAGKTKDDEPPPGRSGEVIQGFMEFVDTHTLRAGFLLPAAGVEGLEMDQALAPLAGRNAERVRAIVEGLESEQRQAAALTWLLKTELQSAFPKRKA
jgi:hypothetical protein